MCRRAARAPLNWYDAGFLIATGTPPEWSADADEEDEFDTVPESGGMAEESNEKRKVGLSFLAGAALRELAVTARWGGYSVVEIEGTGRRRGAVWRRIPGRRPRSSSRSVASRGERGTSAAPTGCSFTSPSGRSAGWERMARNCPPAGVRRRASWWTAARPDGANSGVAMASKSRPRYPRTRISCRGRICAWGPRQNRTIGSRTSPRADTQEVHDWTRGFGRVGPQGRRVPRQPHHVGGYGRGGEDDGVGRFRGRAVDRGRGAGAQRRGGV